MGTHLGLEDPFPGILLLAAPGKATAPAARASQGHARDSSARHPESNFAYQREIERTKTLGKLKDRVAIVTGASKGIGASIAKHLAGEGAAVVVNYASSKD